MSISHQYQNQLAQDRFGRLVTARLNEANGELDYDISERLRAARMQALSKRKIATLSLASSVTASGASAAMTFGDDDLRWRDRLAALLPLLGLVVGLIAINVIQNDRRANELAEIDSALLTDDLPPAAYTDPGFVQFLKLGVRENL
ncbi:MAG: hypothetical protein ACJA2P_002183 [Rhodoferax sp.]|jgi:hypothetical protein